MCFLAVHQLGRTDVLIISSQLEASSDTWASPVNTFLDDQDEDKDGCPFKFQFQDEDK